MNLYFLKNYNNYFNRIVKYYNSYNLYINNYDFYAYQDVNFFENDGISTEQVINWHEDWTPDYLVCCDNENNIKHRWFVLHFDKTRGHQYTLQLRRDIIADNFNSIIDSPCFIQKGKLQDGDPLIYNLEGQTFNQIKKNEILLNGNRQCAWGIVYLSEKLSDTISLASPNLSGAIEIGSTLEGWRFAKFVKGQTGAMKGVVINKTTYSYGIRYYRYSNYNYYSEFCANDGHCTNLAPVPYVMLTPLWRSYPSDAIYKSRIASGLTHQGFLTMFNHTKTFLTGLSNKPYITTQDYDDLNQLNGNIIKTSDNKYYRVNVSNVAPSYWIENIPASAGDLFDDLDEVRSDALTGTADNTSFYITSTDSVTFEIILSEITTGVNTFKYSDINSSTNNDVFQIFAIPVPIGPNISIKKGVNTYSMTQEIAISALQQTVLIGGEKCYDVQILPYCPFEANVEDDVLDLDNVSTNDYTLIDDNITKNGVVFCLPTNKYFNTMPFSLTSTHSIKVSNECEMYRLVSPNYNGIFEFSLAKNGGSIDSIQISCDYKPYQPCIIVQPSFKGLYGSNYQDSRGLILSGDFSIPSRSSQWINYQINNKNYENVFNRQIEHMDFTNNQQLISTLYGNAMDVAKSIASGVHKGGIVGGAIGGLVSSTNASLSTGLMLGTQYENKDYAQDQFAYQLGNIKARPYSINKVGCLNNNFKFFPFIEYYCCTDEEIELFEKKIQYSGMTVNRIDTIANYLYDEGLKFIQGQMIRLEGFSDDSHMFNEIYNEVSKGLYFEYQIEGE